MSDYLIERGTPSWLLVEPIPGLVQENTRMPYLQFAGRRYWATSWRESVDTSSLMVQPLLSRLVSMATADAMTPDRPSTGRRDGPTRCIADMGMMDLKMVRIVVKAQSIAKGCV